VSDELAELKARYERLQRLYTVSEVIHSTLEPQEALQLIVREAVRLVRASSGSVVLVNPTNGFLEILASEGLPSNAAGLKLRVGEGITGWVARTGKPARVGEVNQDARYIMLRPSVRSELAVPLEVQGEVRGVLNVDSDRVDAFDALDEELLVALTVQAAGVIGNTWRYEQWRLKAKWFGSLANVSRAINSTLNLDEALTVITREACKLMSAKVCSVMMLDDTRAWLELRASFGAGDAYTSKPKLNVEESLLGAVVRRKKPVQVENVQISSRYQNVEIARREGLVSLLSVPLIFGDEAMGALSVYTGQSHTFSDDEVRVLAAFAELSAGAIQRGRLYEHVMDVEELLRQNEKLSALGLLAAEVAHEIRNPLTVMKLLYHSLDLKFAPNDPRDKDARLMGEKIDHLNRIVERVLDLARSSEPKFTPVNLNNLIQELCMLVRHKLNQQGVRLTLNLQTDLPEVLGDSTQLEQASLNLIINASEAMSNGGTMEITTRSLQQFDGTHQPTHVQVKFEDTGEGMTKDQKWQLFKSLLHSSKPRGTGLGLAIVTRIVEAHRGELQIASKRHQGTSVSIILPVR